MAKVGKLAANEAWRLIRRNVFSAGALLLPFTRHSLSAR